VEPEQADMPDILRKPDPRQQDEPEVGDFRPGSPLSQLALARYLVGRAIAESIGSTLLLVAVALLALAALSEWGAHSTVLAVFVVLVAGGVLVLRWLMLMIVRRLTGFHRFGPIEHRMTALVADTRADVLRELRRIGLPGRTWTLPLLALRLLSRTRRAKTVARLRSFQTTRAVPRARVDELFLLLRHAVRGGVPSGGGWQTGRHD
jgi:hypothetical protein